MICISIAQASRIYTLADMLNAFPQCDIVEVRLDRFSRTPDIAELLAAKRKPVIMACRRSDEGGDWPGGEADRLALLRECVAQKADYVEVELDVADQVEVTPPTKKIVTYTNMIEPPDNLAAIYAQAAATKPDVIKLAMPARTPEEAWPLVQLLAKPAAPTVVLSLGKAGVMLSILARRVGAPWIYAALERGLEADHNLATLHELDSIYHYQDIGKGTRFVGVTGFGMLARLRVALLNAALKDAGQPFRCLPLAIGEIPLLRKVLEAIKTTHVAIDDEHVEVIRPMAAEVDKVANGSGAIDWLQMRGTTWQGFNMRGLSLLSTLRARLNPQASPNQPFQGLTVVLVGLNNLATALGSRIAQGGGVPILACSNLENNQDFADMWNMKAIDLDSIASTPHQALIVCDRTDLSDANLAANATVADWNARFTPSPFLEHAGRQGCKVLSARELFLDEVSRQAKLLTSQDPQLEHLGEVFDAVLEGS